MTEITELIGTGKKQITMDLVPVEQAAPYAAADVDMEARRAGRTRTVPDLCRIGESGHADRRNFQRLEDVLALDGRVEDPAAENLARDDPVVVQRMRAEQDAASPAGARARPERERRSGTCEGRAGQHAPQGCRLAIRSPRRKQVGGGDR